MKLMWTLCVIVAIALWSSLQAQDSCGNVGPAVAVGGGAGWQKSASITLYIISTSSDPINQSQQSTISQSLTNWNSGVGSNLNITTTILSSAPSSPSPPYILVQVGSTDACGGTDACTSYNYDTTTGYSTYSVMNLKSSALSDTNFLRLMVHEIGHTYLLADCVPPSSGTCDYNLTVMRLPIDSSSGTGPLCCDKNRLALMTQGAGQYGTRCYL
jgi:hypothetical protein